MAEKATVARPYARAAFAYARDHDKLDSWSSWLGTARAVVQSEEYHALASSPGIRTEHLLGLIAGVCGDALDENGRALLGLLAENDRVDYLPEIAEHFEELKAQDQNVADVEIVSAVALSEAQQQRLVRALRTRLRRDVRLHCSVDPALIGGAVVRSGDLLIDGSLASKLERLGTELTTG
jgi:F-type H+-transporting ATPase subunit delta